MKPILISRHICRLVLLIFLFAISGELLCANISPQAKVSLQQRYNALPLTFEPNGGQASEDIRFVSQAPGFRALLKDREVDFLLGKGSNSVGGSVLRMHFTRARFASKPMALNRVETTSNYLLGNSASGWHTGIPNFSRVGYMGLYPGVDAFFYGDHRKFEHDFVVSPGADYHQIRVLLDGARKLSVDNDGSLTAETASGTLNFLIPRTYQYENGQRVEIAARYSLTGKNEFGFEISTYNHDLPLIIDPVLAYSTYLAGGSVDAGTAITVDSTGNAYITGYTFSTNFPIQNSEQASCDNSCFQPDVFVSKLNPTGSALIYSTYVGGSGYDQGSSISVDSIGNAVIVGYTSSFDFPQKNAISAVLSSNTTHGFAFSLSPNGSSLNFSSYLGGVGTDTATGVATDASGTVYVAGYTGSANFPLTAGNQIGAAPGNSGNDVFLTKLSPTGALLSSTLIGGSPTFPGTFNNTNVAVSVAVEPNGMTLLAGAATGGFPTTPGSYQPNYAGTYGTNAFVAALNSSGSALTYATYLGGTGTDSASKVVLDSQGEIVVGGTTTSLDFPTTPGAFQTTNLSTMQSAFVTKMDPALSKLIYSTYLGATKNDYAIVAASGIALDAQGNAFVVGYTNASSFPLVDPLLGTLPQTNFGTTADAAFLSKLNSSGTALTFSTFLSGSVNAAGEGIVVDSAGDPYITGNTFDPDFPTTAGAFQPTIPLPQYPVQHAFVTKFSASVPNPSACFSSSVIYFGTLEPGKSSPPYSVTLTNCGSQALSVSAVTSNNAVFVVTGNTCRKVLPGASCTVKVRYIPTMADGSDMGKLMFSDNAPISPQNVLLIGYSVWPTLYPVENAANFGDEIVGLTSGPLLVQLTNQGSLPVHFTSITSMGDFAPVNKCPAVLQPGEFCSIGATFTPTAAGARLGTILINDDAYGSPQTISLAGNGLTTYTTPTISFLSPSSAKAGPSQVPVTIFGTEFFPTTVVMVNGKPVAAKKPSPTTLQITLPASVLKNIDSISIRVVNPAPGGSSNLVGFVVYGQAALGVADAIYEPFTRKFYASIPAAAAINPNTLARINPDTGAIESSIPIGIDPGALGLSTDGTKLYVGLNGENAVVPFDVPTQTVGTKIPLGADPLKGTLTATSIQVQPNHPDSLVVTVNAVYNSPDGIELIQNGAVHARFLNEPPNNIALGGTRFVNTSNLYGWNENYNALGLDQFVVKGNNLYETTGISGAFGIGPFDTDGRSLYDVNGQVFNATTGLLTGVVPQIINYNPESAVLTDISSGRTFFLDQFGTVITIDSTTLGLVGSLNFPATSPTKRLLHWDSDGLAFLTSNSANAYDLVYYRTSLFLPSIGPNPVPLVTSATPSTVTSKGSNFALLVKGSSFVRGATVLWNGASRTTTWMSQSKLVADIPASDIVTTGTAQITVLNPAPGGGQSSRLPITIQ